MSATLALSLVGAGLSALGGLASSSMQNAANASMDEETRKWQEKMWNKNNQYNTPLAQRHRLEQAGINPALAFQNGNTGVASSSPSAVQHSPADYSALGAGISNAGAQMLQAQQVSAQNELVKSQAEAQRIENSTLELRKLAELGKLKAETKKIGADTSWIDWQEKQSMALFDALSKKSYAEVQSIMSQSALNDALTAINIGRNDREQKQLSAVIAQLRAAANSSNAQAALSRIQAGVIPRLSPEQQNQIADAFVNEALKRSSAEEIAGFRFSGATVEKMKQAVISLLTEPFKK